MVIDSAVHEKEEEEKKRRIQKGMAELRPNRIRKNAEHPKRPKGNEEKRESEETGKRGIGERGTKIRQ